VEDFDPSKHLQKIEQALSQIANITDIALDGTDDPGFGEGNPVELPDEAFGEDYSFFPSYIFVSIRFGIYIPQRLQNQLAYLPEDSPVDTENFNVLITYDDPVPFTIIFYDTKNEFPDPSSAVMVIRKYLEREFKDDMVTFRSLGPSPFHADLTLSEGETLDARREPHFVVNNLSFGEGYKRYEVKYQNQTKDQCAILRDFVNYIGPFLSSFYTFERDQVNLMFLSGAANEQLERLLQIERTKGVRRIRDQLTKSPRIISEILAAMLEIEIEKSRTNKVFLERQRDGQLLEGTPFYYFIEKVRAEQQTFPAAETKEIVLLCEGRRLKLTENLAVLIAGVLGGIVGSLLTWAFTK